VDEDNHRRASSGNVVLNVGTSIVPMRSIAPALSLQEHGEGARELVGDAVKSPLAACKAAVDRAAPASSEPSRGQVLATPGGSAAYESAPRADSAARRSAGSHLPRNWRIQVTARLRAGEVDSCLLVTHAALPSQYGLRATAFGDASSGAVPRSNYHHQQQRGRSGRPYGGPCHGARAAPSLPARTSRPATGRATLGIELAVSSPPGLPAAVLLVHP
jgi:hypothetical protein